MVCNVGKKEYCTQHCILPEGLRSGINECSHIVKSNICIAFVFTFKAIHCCLDINVHNPLQAYPGPTHLLVVSHDGIFCAFNSPIYIRIYIGIYIYMYIKETSV